MTAKELISYLQKFPEDTKVYLDDYSCYGDFQEYNDFPVYEQCSDCDEKMIVLKPKQRWKDIGTKLDKLKKLSYKYLDG